ncbi:hypothetical protein PCE1_001067 [Barthelona sp. PCE]
MIVSENISTIRERISQHKDLKDIMSADLDELTEQEKVTSDQVDSLITAKGVNEVSFTRLTPFLDILADLEEREVANIPAISVIEDKEKEEEEGEAEEKGASCRAIEQSVATYFSLIDRLESFNEVKEKSELLESVEKYKRKSKALKKQLKVFRQQHMEQKKHLESLKRRDRDEKKRRKDLVRKKANVMSSQLNSMLLNNTSTISSIVNTELTPTQPNRVRVSRFTADKFKKNTYQKKIKF